MKEITLQKLLVCRSGRRPAAPQGVGRHAGLGVRPMVPVEQQRRPRRLAERRQGGRLSADRLPGELLHITRRKPAGGRLIFRLSGSQCLTDAVVCPSFALLISDIRRFALLHSLLN